MRPAIVLHLFYEDVAIELIDAIARAGLSADVFATGEACSAPSVMKALDRLDAKVEIIEAENAGRDVGPFLQLLPLLLSGGYDVFCKLHTKRGHSGYGTPWRRTFYRALVGSPALVDQILGAFSAHPDLAIVGPEPFFLSTAGHLPSNTDDLFRLARLCFPGRKLPDDWGFFAGTMFWGRTAQFKPFARLAQLGVVFEREDGNSAEERTAHALERVFGLAGVLAGRQMGLVAGNAAGPAGAVRVVPGTALPDKDLQYRLMEIKRSEVTSVSPHQVEKLVRRENPLVHYIEKGLDTEFDPNPYFHTAWYREANPEVLTRHQNPLAHFIERGAASSRDPSPLFDIRSYYRQHPELYPAGINPLEHFLTHGGGSGNQPLPEEADMDGPDGRLVPSRHVYPFFDETLERAFVARLGDVDATVRRQARRTLVSVIMAVKVNTAGADEAIASVLGQSHAKFELVVATFGGRGSSGVISHRHLSDRRVKLVHTEANDAFAARNAALGIAAGDLIAYLDPGNCWKPRFLEYMSLFMAADDRSAAYCVAEFRVETACVGYQGAEYDRRTLLSDGSVALNALCHRRALYDEFGGFEPDIPFAATELLLRYARREEPQFAPFLGVEYRGDNVRVQLAPPSGLHAWLKVIEAKTELSSNESGWRPIVAERLSLTFGIKIAAFRGPEYAPYEELGDYHFATALKEALERRGHVAFIDPPWDWYDARPTPDDVAIVIRGVLPYEPRPNQVNMIWNISHPEKVLYEEYERFDLAYVASLPYAAFLRTVLSVPVKALLQATNTRRFHPVNSAKAPSRGDIVFVGNARSVVSGNARSERREIVNWAIDAGFEPAIYGSGWEQSAPARLVKADYVDNAKLAQLYAGAGVVLNDHYEAMRDFGFVSNRVYDVLASGGNLVSDHVPSIERIFGSAVRMVRRPGELAKILRDARRTSLRSRRQVVEWVARYHDFDERAGVILADAMTLIGLAEGGVRSLRAPVEPVAFRRSGDDRPRVRALVRTTAQKAPDDMAFVRLICPLTDDAAKVELSLAEDDVGGRPDVYIVQQGSIDGRQFKARVQAMKASGAAIIVDVDREPSGEVDHKLIAAADQVWFADEELHNRYGGLARSAHHVPSGVDRRLWKDYAQESPDPAPSQPLQLLLFERPQGRSDLEFFWSALRRLADERAGAFRVSVVSERKGPPERGWITRLTPPASAQSYPRWARWLRIQGPFHAAFVPHTEVEAAAVEMRYLECTAMGLPTFLSRSGARRRAEGGGAVVVGNTVDDWYDALRAFVANPGLFAALGKAATQRVWREHDVRQCSELQSRLIEAVVSASRPSAGVA